MTTQELQAKLDASLDKVTKRRNTIAKVCKALNINLNDVLSSYEKVASECKTEYLPSKTAKELVNTFVQEIPTRDSNGNWNNDAYDFNYKIDQLADNMSKLYEVERIAKGWQTRLDIQKNKENAPKIEVLWDFLNRWEVQARDWYQENANYLVNMMNEFHEIEYNFLIENDYSSKSYDEVKELVSKWNEYMFNEYQVLPRYRKSAVDVDDYIRTFNIDGLTRELSTIRFQYENEHSSYDNHFGYGANSGKYYLKSFDIEKLNKLLAQEKLRKYEDLCNRITDVVGEIQDVSNLSIGNQNGELNGIVRGSNGSARVETIGAGGYNVGRIVNVRSGQCFHYRVLVNKIN